MKIFIWHFLYERPDSLPIDLEETTTIKELKDLIQSKLGINSLEQELMKGHKPLMDYLTVSDYQVKEDDTILLHLRLRKGSSSKALTDIESNMTKLTKISSTKEAVEGQKFCFQMNFIQLEV